MGNQVIRNPSVVQEPEGPPKTETLEKAVKEAVKSAITKGLGAG